MIIYEKLSDLGEDGILRESIKATLDDNSILSIPLDPANSDYQAYLATLVSNSSTPQVGN